MKPLGDFLDVLRKEPNVFFDFWVGDDGPEVYYIFVTVKRQDGKFDDFTYQVIAKDNMVNTIPKHSFVGRAPYTPPVAA